LNQESRVTLTFATDATVSQTRILVRASPGAGDRIIHSFSPAIVAPDLAGVLPIATRIEALDILEHVVDEEHLVRAMAERLAPGGEMVVRVPVEGPVTWLDALNLYRYMQDVTGLGKKLEETKMKGWHRHYRPTDVTRMLRAAGLTVTSSSRSGSPHLDVLHFGALAWGTIVRHDPGVERRLMDWRDQAETGDRLPRLGPLSTRVTIHATRA